MPYFKLLESPDANSFAACLRCRHVSEGWQSCKEVWQCWQNVVGVWSRYMKDWELFFDMILNGKFVEVTHFI